MRWGSLLLLFNGIDTDGGVEVACSRHLCTLCVTTAQQFVCTAQERFEGDKQGNSHIERAIIEAERDKR